MTAGAKPLRNLSGRKADGRYRKYYSLNNRGELIMGIAIWIIVILVIAALIKYLLSNSGKK
jgi:hypothetical protein